MKKLTQLNAWASLEKYSKIMRLSTIKQLHEMSMTRHLDYTLTASNITIDFSNQRINDTTIERLLLLAQSSDLYKKIQGLMQGDNMNPSQQQPALHTALRIQDTMPLFVNNKNIIPDIMETRDKMRHICNTIREGSWLGYSGKPITDIVNIGIGGSDLGPRFCLRALAHYAVAHLNYHFISDIDPHAFSNVVMHLNPETTLFIISSKSFHTRETLYNAEMAFAWLGTSINRENHIIAITANRPNAQHYGIKHILPIWEWVGGRYSTCSAINLMTAIAIGFEQFSQLLMGAHSMDVHFQQVEFSKNLPVLLALVGIWNNNFFNIHNQLMLTYSQQLEYLVPFIQQLDMESNGKSLDNDGNLVNYSTGPIVWGGLGNQAQHSYYQLLCQGTHHIAVDFITLKKFEDKPIHSMFMAKKQVLTEGIIDEENSNGYIPGNLPSNHISIPECSPFNIGALIALYEHKVFTQSVIWNINPFDQPGVESAKRAGRGISNRWTA